MISFDLIHLNEQVYQLQEITFNGAIKVSMVDVALNEKRITVFLNEVLNGIYDTLKMTVQERYLLLIRYLEGQGQTLIATDSAIDYSGYYSIAELSRTSETSYCAVYQLTGYDAEFLEKRCTSIAEWIACMMAIQMEYVDGRLPERPTIDEPESYEERFIARLELIKAMPLTEFNEVYEDYIALSHGLQNVVYTMVSDNGIVLRGTDDAPCRFRPSTALSGIFKDLET